MVNRMTIKVLFKAGVAGAAIGWLCGCADGAADSQPQPNFIVQDVQTGTRAGEGRDEAEKDTGLLEIQDEYKDVQEKDQEMDRIPDTTGEKPDGDADLPDDTDVSADGCLPAGEIGDLLEVSSGDADVESDGSGEIMIMSVAEMDLLEAQTAVDLGNMTPEEIACCFYFEEVPDAVLRRMEGKSFGEDCTVPLSQLRYVRVLHYGFDGRVYIGELVVNQGIAQDAVGIFRELFDAKYPIEKMVLVDDYGADDNASMADNNTSCFNYRVVEGTESLSLHAYGLAIDINPLYNPYLPVRDGVIAVLPENAGGYVDRSAECEYYIRQGDLCYKAFVDRGFSWGGDWKVSKDYQHFSKTFD